MRAVVEIAERFSFYGVLANLITFLTSPLRRQCRPSTRGTTRRSCNHCLLSGTLVDSWLGLYRTIVLASLIYILGGEWRGEKDTRRRRSTEWVGFSQVCKF
jgi:peptide/histidine transporter 3/4